MRTVWRNPWQFITLTSLIAVLVLGGSGRGIRAQEKTPPASTESAAIFVGAGDIASCRGDGDEKTAALLDKIPGTVFTAGDNVYPDGKIEEFRNCYDRTWGRHKDRTRPAPGNHDWHTPNGAGYFEYFGAAAGEPGKGWYSYNLGEWHIIVLNSNCDKVGGCGLDSPQVNWLRADLEANPRACTAAIWHHPRFSSGRHGNSEQMQNVWEILYEAGADVVFNGHDHTYERFAPMNARGERDDSRGIREFVVGTGGAGLYSFLIGKKNSEVKNNKSWGVLKLTLKANSLEWEFVPVKGASFTDKGSSPCH